MSVVAGRIERRLVVVLLLAAVGFMPLAVQACTCAWPLPACSAYWNTQAVFVGEAIGITQEPSRALPDGKSFIQGGYLVSFQLLEGFRGVSGGVVTVRTGQGDSDCGYRFQLRHRYLVYASDWQDSLHTNICTRTAPVEKAQEDLNYIRSLPRVAPGGTLYGWVMLRKRTKPLPAQLDNVPLSSATVVAAGTVRFTTLTDERGNYRFAQLPAGDYTVGLELPTNLWQPSAKATVPDRGCSEVNLITGPNGRIRGWVQDAAGKGLPEIRVDAIPWALREKNLSDVQWLDGTAYTGAQGDYEIRHLEPGEYLLAVNLWPKPPWETAYPRQYFFSTNELTFAKTILVGDGELLIGLNFTLPGPLELLQVRVLTVWADGSPAGGSQLLYAPRAMGYLFFQAPQTDSEGRATLRMHDDTEYLVCATNQDAYGRKLKSEAQVIRARRDLAPIRLALAHTGRECPNYRKLAGRE